MQINSDILAAKRHKKGILDTDFVDYADCFSLKTVL